MTTALMPAPRARLDLSEGFVMTETHHVLRELRALAKSHLLAKSAFNRAYCLFWHAQVKPCSDETGWKLLESFHRQVEHFRFKLNRPEQGVDNAAWEMFRLQMVGDADCEPEDVTGFVKWYEALTRKIGSSIDHLYDYHGDSFADLIDAYPLAGRDLVVRALASHPKSGCPPHEGFLEQREVSHAVLDKLGPHWHKFICAGENYVIRALETSCHEYFLHRILTGRDDQVTWTEEEQDAIGFADHYDH